MLFGALARARRACAVAVALTSLPHSLGASTPAERLRILSPASEGGGLDLTAQAVAHALRDSAAVSQVELLRSPARGGIIGLAQLTTYGAGDADVLLVGGLSMITTLKANKAALSLLETTPIARLAGDYLLIVVPPSSPFQTFADLLSRLRSDAETLPWAGNLPGSVSHVLVAAIADAAGVDPARVAYVPFAGGREVAAAVSAGQVPVGVGGLRDFGPDIQSGRLRPLAVSSETAVPGLQAPSLREQGLALTLVNWRGVFAPAGISEGSRRALLEAVAAMVRHASWRETLRERRWADLYLPGEPFARFVAAQEQQVARLRFPAPRPAMAVAAPAGQTTRWTLVLTALAVGLVVLALASRRRRSPILQAEIDREFERWRLSAAEKEIAQLLLRGLRHKDIASLRGTNELTVRHQALAIYKKAGLDSRRDLAAHFLGQALQTGRAD
jgi:putative tricarboxylic transport membrane protein